MKRRLRPFLLAMLLLGLFLGGLRAYRWNIERRGKAELTAVLAELDATDPTWRRDAQPQPLGAPHTTAVTLIARTDRLFSAKFLVYLERSNGTRFLHDIPHNARLDDGAFAILEAGLEGCERVRPVARLLASLPSGYRTLEPQMTTFGAQRFAPATQTARMRAFVEREIERFNTLSDATSAMRGVRVLCNLAMIYDHPSCWCTVWGVVNRYYEIVIACQHLERVLGMGIPSPQELASLQAMLVREADFDYDARLREANRADMQACYQWLKESEGSLATKLEILRLARPLRDSDRIPTKTQASAFVFAPHFDADHAASLRYFTALVVLGRLPQHQRMAAYPAVPRPNATYTIAQRMYDLTADDAAIPLEAQAKVRCAVVALAAERYRQAAGHWPEFLSEIPKTLLPSVPDDPFTGQPLLLKRRGDGLTIYSVGADGIDDVGDVPTTAVPVRYSPHKDVGFRLYNPDQRRIAPRPVQPRYGFGYEPAPPVLGPMPRVVEGA